MILPPGKANIGWGYYLGDDTYPEVKTVPMCECGASITMGKDDASIFHSDYCLLKVCLS